MHVQTADIEYTLKTIHKIAKKNPKNWKKKPQQYRHRSYSVKLITQIERHIYMYFITKIWFF